MASSPHPAAVAALVLAGVGGFPAIREALAESSLSALIPRSAPLTSEKVPTALEDTIRDLASDDFKKRDEASQQLKKLLPKNLDAIQKAHDSTDDPEVRDRLNRALRDHHQAQLEPAEEEQPDKAGIAIGRLRHILRLTKGRQAEQWLDHLLLLGK